VRIGLDATYSLGKNLSGVGIYSREILFGLARSHPDHRFSFYYRPHRFLRSFSDSLPRNSHRRLLRGAPNVDLFHALNQRVDEKARRTITTFHDLFVMTAEYSSPEFRARFTDQARRAADLSDAIISVSEFTATQIVQLLGVERSRIHVIPHGVRVPDAAPVSAREKIVLFVGAIQRRKNVGRLVKAFEALPTAWKLILAGAADGFGATEELRAVEESPRRSDIQVLGYVSDDTLRGLYRSASIFAFPSLDEGFGMPVLEAMAQGVPVITSNCSAMPEVAGEAALLVDPQNSDELASALVKVAADEGLRDALVRRGYARAKEFTWESAAAKTWLVYSKITGV
jgi:glycosyltransferase involved in cell wall biosynthesis